MDIRILLRNFELQGGLGCGVFSKRSQNVRARLQRSAADVTGSQLGNGAHISGETTSERYFLQRAQWDPNGLRQTRARFDTLTLRVRQIETRPFKRNPHYQRF